MEGNEKADKLAKEGTDVNGRERGRWQPPKPKPTKKEDKQRRYKGKALPMVMEILRKAWPGVGEGTQPSGDGGRPHIEIETSAARLAGQVASSFVVCDSGCSPAGVGGVTAAEEPG